MRRVYGGARQAGKTAQRAVGDAPDMVFEDCWVLHTDKDGRTFVQEHRVWNRDRFAQALAKAAQDVGGEAKAELITEAQYRRELLKGARADNPTGRRRK